MPTDPTDALLTNPRFPRSAGYHPAWVRAAVGGGAHPLWLTEWLTEAVGLAAGMRVLDLGCGRAASSVFLRREFGALVWAADLWNDPTDNFRRVRDAGVADGVFPLRADARSLPFPGGYFDAVLCVDSFMYFATDDLYLNALCRVVAPGGVVGLAGAGLARELDGPPPAHLRGWWEPAMCCLHSAGWWKRHWERPGLVDVTVADDLPDGWRFWLDWQRAVCPDNAAEVAAIDADRGDLMGYVRVVARRRPGVEPDPPITSLPGGYTPAPLLRHPA